MIVDQEKGKRTERLSAKSFDEYPIDHTRRHNEMKANPNIMRHERALTSTKRGTSRAVAKANHQGVLKWERVQIVLDPSCSMELKNFSN